MEASTLSKLYALDGPFTTIYLDTHSDVEDAAEQLEIRWKNVVRELEESGVDAATIEALSAARGEHGRGNTRVLVAAHGVVHLAISLPQPPPRDEVAIGNLPRLVPLVDALGLQLPHVVVLADRKGADILAYTAGPDPDESASVTNDRFPDRKVHAGGWAAKRYSNDVEETWEASARDVAEVVDRIARDVDARLVLASGDERALQLLGQHLPTPLVDRYVTIAGGGRHEDGSDELIADEVLRVLGETIAADTVELLEDFAQERGQNDRAAEGADAVLAALRKGQVATLILTDIRDQARTAFFGPDPTHVALTATELIDLGVEQPWEGPLDEIAVRAALGTGAAVKFVGGGMEQAPAEGIGALLRYSD
ncbi:MAG TPA: Vms1/Ankzf1 family peptidyl-tRNA hydrolase [Mycobacteriales bacterium]|nr:Vms1/Ankzf1 family peptidyl-tRNA hydrolase [Mycobacteriales bacterium]